MLFDINLSHSLQNLHAQPHPRAKRNTRRERSVDNLLNHEHFRFESFEHLSNTIHERNRMLIDLIIEVNVITGKMQKMYKEGENGCSHKDPGKKYLISCPHFGKI